MSGDTGKKPDGPAGSAYKKDQNLRQQKVTLNWKYSIEISGHGQEPHPFNHASFRLNSTMLVSSFGAVHSAAPQLPYPVGGSRRSRSRRRNAPHLKQGHINSECNMKIDRFSILGIHEFSRIEASLNVMLRGARHVLIQVIVWCWCVGVIGPKIKFVLIYDTVLYMQIITAISRFLCFSSVLSIVCPCQLMLDLSPAA
jgi:hypothetical protein